MSTPLTPLSAADLNAKSPSKPIQKSDSDKPWTVDDKPFAGDIATNTPVPPSSSGVEDEHSSNSLFSADFRGRELFNISNVRTPTKAPSPSKDSPVKKIPSTSRDSASLRFNEGLTRVMQTMKDEVTLDDDDDEGDSMTTIGAESVSGDIDDTAFSTFSAVPNAEMTLLARSGLVHGEGSGSPVKGLGIGKHQRDLVCAVVPYETSVPHSYSTHSRISRMNTMNPIHQQLLVPFDTAGPQILQRHLTEDMKRTVPMILRI